jgi:hypothetical protein
MAMSRSLPSPLFVVPRRGVNFLCTVRSGRLVEVAPAPVPLLLTSELEPVLVRSAVDDHGRIAWIGEDGRSVGHAVCDASLHVGPPAFLPLPEGARPRALVFHRGVLYVGGGAGREILGLFDLTEASPRWVPLDVPAEVLKYGKRVDDLVMDGDRLIAVDNVILPRWLLVYDAAAPRRPRLVRQQELAAHGTYEHVFAASLGPHLLALLSGSVGEGGQGQHVGLLDRHTLQECVALGVHHRWRDRGTEAEAPSWYDVAWSGNVLLLAAGRHGLGILPVSEPAQAANPDPLEARLDELEARVRGPRGVFGMSEDEYRELLGLREAVPRRREEERRGLRQECMGRLVYRPLPGCEAASVVRVYAPGGPEGGALLAVLESEAGYDTVLVDLPRISRS